MEKTISLSFKYEEELFEILRHYGITLEEAVNEFLKTLVFYKEFPICVTSPKSDALDNAIFATGIQMTGGKEPSNFGKICLQLLSEQIITLEQSRVMIETYWNKELK